jgi:NAD(P)-dependent dehydrogenase (short-subunit alcohol dehydrogenase family)
MPIADVTDASLAQLVSLKGRRAVVTGGAQGLGKAIARRLAEAGASVAIGDIQDELAQSTAAALAARYGGKVVAMHTDVADTKAVAALATFANAELGGIDIWVNNAGITGFGPLLDMTDEAWDRVQQVNLRGLFAGSREAAKRMIDDGRGGVIINIASLAGLGGISPGLAPYVASKHGVVGATKQMAIELAPHGIRVMAIAPGVVVTETNMPKGADGVDPLATIPGLTTTRLGRIGVPDDIGRAALFCASDLSLFMTGSTLVLDAGETA